MAEGVLTRTSKVVVSTKDRELLSSKRIADYQEGPAVTARRNGANNERRSSVQRLIEVGNQIFLVFDSD
jgi:hypothetical protein